MWISIPTFKILFWLSFFLFYILFYMDKLNLNILDDFIITMLLGPEKNIKNE